MLIFDLTSEYCATSSAIFFAVFVLFFISSVNSWIRLLIEFNLNSEFFLSSGLSENSISCSICSNSSFSLVILSSADFTNLSILSNWEVFWLRMPETSPTSSRSNSIFFSIECKPEVERLSIERTSLSCFSALFLSFVASCFFCRNWITSFSNDANKLIKRNDSVKLLIWSWFDFHVKKINHHWSQKSFFKKY